MLRAGAEKARALATPLIRELRHAVGLRAMTAPAAAPAKAAAKAALPVFKQYREADGRFYFKLTDAAGRTLLQSRAFDSPREAGQAVKRLQAEGAPALAALAPQLDAQASQPAERVAEALAQLQDAPV